VNGFQVRGKDLFIRLSAEGGDRETAEWLEAFQECNDTTDRNSQFFAAARRKSRLLRANNAKALIQNRFNANSN
jgi:hypothetical protein